MSRSALRLAALASSAVPGLDPVSVEGAPTGPGDLYELAFVTDSQQRHWVVKAARTAAAGALLEDVNGLMTLLTRRLEFTIPVVRGAATVAAGRAVVHPRVPGQALDFAALPAAAPLTAEVGRTLAHIHNLELAVFEEAGRPSYDAETHRKRLLSDLDRASATGHVPTPLLGRWEHRLEDVSLWRFAPTPVHGAYTGSHVLASFEEQGDGGSGRVRGVIGWEEARVGDPADDLAELVAQARPAALDTVLEAYVQSRIERPDPNLVRRARLAAEMSLVHRLLRALSAGEGQLVEHLSGELRTLDEWVQEAEQRAEARRLRAEREARRQRELAQAAAAAASTPQPQDEATQPFAGPAPATTDEATQPFAGPVPDLADEATQPFAGPAPATTDEATQPFAGPVPDLADEATQPFAGPAAADDLTQPFAPTASVHMDAAGPSTPDSEPYEESTAQAGGRDGAATTTTDERGPEHSWQLSTAVDPGGLFEIDAVEPLPEPVEGVQLDGIPEDADAFDDRHEGASDFVPVDRWPEGGHDRARPHQPGDGDVEHHDERPDSPTR